MAVFFTAVLEVKLIVPGLINRSNNHSDCPYWPTFSSLHMIYGCVHGFMYRALRRHNIEKCHLGLTWTCNHLVSTIGFSCILARWHVYIGTTLGQRLWQNCGNHFSLWYSFSSVIKVCQYERRCHVTSPMLFRWNCKHYAVILIIKTSSLSHPQIPLFVSDPSAWINKEESSSGQRTCYRWSGQMVAVLFIVVWLTLFFLRGDQ